jgi:vancomycin permeability regulator SanA
MESRVGLWLKSFCAGTSALIAVTSCGALVAAVRSGQSIGPYVWVECPLGTSLVASIVWHGVLAVGFAVAALHLMRPFLPEWFRQGIIGLRRPRSHVVVAILLAILCLLALKDTLMFYWLLAAGRIASSFPAPLSLFLFVLLFVTTTLVWDIPLPAQRPIVVAWLVGLIGFVTGSCGLVLLHLVTFGTTDYTRPADVAIVLGARVYRDGVPSLALHDRLQTAIELYEAGHVKYLLMTGGTGREGANEARVMRQVATDAGVPADHILIDEAGVNTLASARNCRRILDEHGLSTALVVSHYYHLARCKLAFAEQGLACTTVPARMSMRLIKEPFYVARECVAYITYAMGRPFRAHRSRAAVASQCRAGGSTAPHRVRHAHHSGVCLRSRPA